MITDLEAERSAASLVERLISCAHELADAQIYGVKDDTGFNNADVHVGRHLASLVSMDPANDKNVQNLAYLVGVKYERQSEGRFGSALVEQFRAISNGREMTQEDRDIVRSTVVVKRDGADLVFTLQNKELEKCFKAGHQLKTEDGSFQWKCPSDKAHSAFERFFKKGAIIQTDDAYLQGIQAPASANERTVFTTCDDKHVYLSFKYDPQKVVALRSIHEKEFEGAPHKFHKIPLRMAANALDSLQRTDAECGQLQHIVQSMGIERAVTVPKIECKEQGADVVLKFPYNPSLTEAIKTLPYENGRRPWNYDGDTRTWTLKSHRLPEFLERVQGLPNVDVSRVREVCQSLERDHGSAVGIGYGY